MKISKKFQKEVEENWKNRDCVITKISREIYRQFKERYYIAKAVYGDCWQTAEENVHEKLFRAGMMLQSSKNPEEFLTLIKELEIEMKREK